VLFVSLMINICLTGLLLNRPGTDVEHIEPL